MINRIRNIHESIRHRLDTLFPAWRKKKIFPSELVYSRENSFPELEIYILPKLVASGSLVFDIGANVGDYTHAFEREQRFSGIYAFEPIPALNERLKSLFPRLEVWDYALSDKAGHASFHIPLIKDRKYDTRGTLLANNKEIHQSGMVKMEVRTTTLDAFCKERKLSNIGCIKVDVEGHEFETLKGAAEVLTTEKPLVMVEIEQRHHPYPIEDIFRFFSALGFKGYFLERGQKIFLPLSEFRVENHQMAGGEKSERYHNNFFFIYGEKGPDLSAMNAIADKIFRS